LPKANVICIDSGPHRARVLARRNQLVESHLELVEPIARAIHQGLPPSFTLDDLISAGHWALIHAATSYRDELGVPFAAWARLRVRGAIRKACAYRTWRGKPSKQWRENTRASITPLPLAERFDAHSGRKTPAELALERIATRPDVEERIDSIRQTRRLSDALAFLSEPEKRVVELYYGAEEPTLLDVCERMALSRPHVRKLHARAISELRSRLAGGPFERAA
jgi:RNA polymerase sigma factor for flagellar operon FliA